MSGSARPARWGGAGSPSPPCDPARAIAVAIGYACALATATVPPRSASRARKGDDPPPDASDGTAAPAGAVAVSPANAVAFAPASAAVPRCDLITFPTGPAPSAVPPRDPSDQPRHRPPPDRTGTRRPWARIDMH
jgi:hypothetical protein